VSISSRIRHVTVTAATALALGLGGFAVAAPAHAQTAVPAGSVAASDPNGISYNYYWTTLSNGQWSMVIPAGGLTMTAGSSLSVAFVDAPPYNVKLSMQGDGNFVFYADNGKTWAANTRPDGYKAAFQGDGNFIVRNSAGTERWQSGTHTYRHAILAFQEDRNLVIYESVSDLKPLWASGTNS
jgi:hypothetical protein